MNQADIQQKNARQALEDFILLADKNDIAVLINLHSCSNHILWEAGGFDYDPGIDPGWSGQSDETCNNGEDEYNENIWLDNLREIARLPEQLKVNNVIGIDIFNEPWSFTWQEWKDLSEKAYAAINKVNPDILIWVEGASYSLRNGKGNPHGNDGTIPNWGENFFEMKSKPLSIPKDRLVITPHTYGPSVYVNRQFLQNDCSDLNSADEAADNVCEIVIDSAKLEAGWEEHFGYLKELDYAVVIGEFGGNLNWPIGELTINPNKTPNWQHIASSPDKEWQNTLVDYMIKKDIEGCYASVNPEPSGDVNIGGLYQHLYTPEEPNNWGLWGDFDWDKINLLKRLWGTQ